MIKIIGDKGKSTILEKLLKNFDNIECYSTENINIPNIYIVNSLAKLFSNIWKASNIKEPLDYLIIYTNNKEEKELAEKMLPYFEERCICINSILFCKED